MNLFNRVAMSLILLTFIVLVVLSSLIPRTVIQVLSRFVQDADRGLDPISQLISAVVGLVLALLAFLLLYAELKPSTGRSVVVAKTPGATAELAIESVAMRVKAVAEQVVGVREAIPLIRSRGRAVDIQLRLTTSPDIDIPRKSEEVMQVVRAEAEEKMGVPVKDLRITVKHGGMDRRAGTPPPPNSSPKPPRPA